MKKFNSKFLSFTLPILLLLLGLELYVRKSENSFKTKSDYLQNNLTSVENIVLGTSHSQNGINPIFFSSNTANISYGSQDIKTDSALLFRFAPQMPKLKTVFFEYDYHRLDINNGDDFYRIPWYYIFYGVQIKPLSYLKKISLYYSNPDFFNNIILDRLKNKPQPKINKYGFVEENYTDEYIKLNYDSLAVQNLANKNLENRHKEISEENFQRNADKIISVITFCKKNNLRLVFVATPLTHYYRKAEIPQKKKKVDSLMQHLKRIYNVQYFDFSSNPDFKITDFSNEDHLNAKGAEKYSKKLNQLVR